MPSIKKRHVTWRVTGREDRLKRADAITVFEQKPGPRFRAGKTKKHLPRFASVQRKVAAKESRFPLTDR